MSWDPPAGICDVNCDYFTDWMDRVLTVLGEIRDRLPPPNEKAPSSEPGAAPSVTG